MERGAQWVDPKAPLEKITNRKEEKKGNTKRHAKVKLRAAGGLEKREGKRGITELVKGQSPIPRS